MTTFPLRLLAPRCRRQACFLVLFACCFEPSVGAVEPEKSASGRVDGEKAIATMNVPPGFKVELFAAEPELRHPVAFCLDEQGRVFVAEEARFNRGTEENRKRAFLLDDDLQCNTLADRLKMYEKHRKQFPGEMNYFTEFSDKVRLLEDRDGDGKADRSTVFADGFNKPLDGLAAGVMARDGDVYLTCIPDLWKLRDRDGDGKADERESLAHGFGVNCAYLGHDLHGLVWGPDGKLYFSVGDRGFDVETQEGRHLHGPRRGAVFRCNPDGSQLEVVHRGLRNPQELAFDAYGNLFADDNNCDKGDHARLVFVVDGGDTGWNMSFQTLPPPYLVGPWHAERMWHLAPAADQPAYIVPACGRIGTGPSGFAYNGTDALGPTLKDHFFMANYTGNGGIETFRAVPKGASFVVEGYRDFLKPMRPTDVDFGYDGKMYISDYGVLDWTGAGNLGRIYTLFDPKQVTAQGTREIKQLFADGFAKQSTERLLTLLAHSDMRVRQRAQFALAARGDEAHSALTRLALADGQLLPRLHALWAVGQLAVGKPERLQPLLALLDASDARLRSQAASTCGEVGYTAAADRLIACLTDADPHVQLRAALALGKLGDQRAIEPLVEFLRRNNDVDPYLRHAAVRGLELLGAAEAAAALSNDPSAAVRLGAVLVLRRLEDRRLVRFLDDKATRVATEAARAINDLMWDDVMPELADRLPRWTVAAAFESDPLLRRAVNAAFRRGSDADVAAVVATVESTRVASAVREEALRALGDWQSATTRDRVTGAWRPTAARPSSAVVQCVNEHFTALLASADGPLQAEVIRLAAKLKLQVDEPFFLAMVGDDRSSLDARVAALQLLSARKSKHTDAAADRALGDALPRLRSEARNVLATTQPERALALLTAVLATDDADVREQQEAFATLGSMQRADSDREIAAWLAKLERDEIAPELALDVLKAAEGRNTPDIAKPLRKYMGRLDAETDPLRKFRHTLVGGDAEQGRILFTTHRHAQCIRCHKVQGTGGDAGPDLSKVAEKNDRTYLLQSLVDPNAKIAPGFGSVVLAMSDGTLVAGVLKDETPDRLTVVTPEGRTVTVAAGDVEERTPPKSPMPPMHEILPRREMRDIIEFLSTLK